MANNTNTINFPIQTSNPSIYYCDPGDIARVLSIEGIKLSTQDYGNGSVSGEVGAVEDAIWEATDQVNFYCFTHYDPGHMVLSTWVNRAATNIACYLLRTRRGNPCPASIELRYKQTLAELEKVHSANYEIPGVPLRATAAPSWSNVRIDQLYQIHRIRVERCISERTPASYDQSIDWASIYEYDI